jgi:hypothetical protein
LPGDIESKARVSSAVDEVIKILWGESSSEGMADQSTPLENHKGQTKEINNYPKQPDMATTNVAGREGSSSKPRAPLEAVKDQADSSQAQGPTHERRGNHKERGGRGGYEPSR